MKKVKSFISLFLAVLMVAGCMATASAAAGEKVPNDDVSSATLLKKEETLSDTLNTAEDKDYYKFTSDVIGLATVKIAHSALTGATASYFKVTVVDAAENVIDEFTSAGSSSSDLSAAFTVAKDAVYYVIVERGSVYDSSVTYSVSVSLDSTVLTETEPNNSEATAPAMSLSVSGNSKVYYGTLTENDIDCYRVTLTKPGVLNLYLYNGATKTGNYKALLKTYSEGYEGEEELYDVTSISIAKNEASVMGPSVCVPEGDYTLVITGDLGSYSTKVFFREAANIETEINDTAATADGIAVGTTYKATLDEVADVDYFKFAAVKDNKGFDFNFKAAAEGKWNVRILNSDKEPIDAKTAVIEVNATVNSKEAKIETMPLEAGTYYIEVTSAKEGKDYNSDIYEISVTARNEALDDGEEEEKSFIDRIKELNWGSLWKNFEGWFDQINIMGMVSSITASIVTIITFLSSFLGK